MRDKEGRGGRRDEEEGRMVRKEGRGDGGTGRKELLGECKNKKNV